ncbi:hypothetical protein GTY41_07260 [Streptomyces sp. SID685]|uniref:hypothetical protein n=1 Tax=Streptomyces TaxID=1883 RepID=UPI00136E58B4|nr:hypothetical protein [Streptomyces sp. SID685]MYR84755.1 hypothetical protein [Streptomyces sp. SID685]
MANMLASGSTPGIVQPAYLRSAEDSKDSIKFEYTPAEISISHNAEGVSDSSGQGADKGDPRSLLDQMATRGSTRLVMSLLTFTGGEQCRRVVEYLCRWVTPKPAEKGATGQPKREVLKFEWGPPDRGFNYAVELMRFDCTYTRFSRDGQPIRTEVRNLTLHVLDNAASGDNTRLAPPASGAGRPAKPGTGARPSAFTKSASGAGNPGAGAPTDPNADPTREFLRRSGK